MRTYPKGTPIEELDVQIELDPAVYPRPIVAGWIERMGSYNALLLIDSPSTEYDKDAPTAYKNYKRLEEVWLDMKRSQYEEKLTSSPLEKGLVVELNESLNVCYSKGAWRYESSDRLLSKDKAAYKIGFNPNLHIMPTVVRNFSSRARLMEAATQWNALDNQLALSLADPMRDSRQILKPDDPHLIQIMINAWSVLAPDDPRNLPLDAAEATIGLGDDEKERLCRKSYERPRLTCLRAKLSCQSHKLFISRNAVFR